MKRRRRKEGKKERGKGKSGRKYGWADRNKKEEKEEFTIVDISARDMINLRPLLF